MPQWLDDISYIFYDIQKDTKFQNKNKITKVVSFILHRVVYEGEIINGMVPATAGQAR